MHFKNILNVIKLSFTNHLKWTTHTNNKNSLILTHLPTFTCVDWAFLAELMLYKPISYQRTPIRKKRLLLHAVTISNIIYTHIHKLCTIGNSLKSWNQSFNDYSIHILRQWTVNLIINNPVRLVYYWISTNRFNCHWKIIGAFNGSTDLKCFLWNT